MVLCDSNTVSESLSRFHMHHEVRENRLIMINGQRNGINPSISLFSYGDRVGSPRLGDGTVASYAPEEGVASFA